jgi:tRNA-splicing ligase RtcB (3'-phosphate/5'-hydroxy nucleic acid ligase)
VLARCGSSVVPRGCEADLHARGQKEQTAGVECRKDSDVLDEIPSAYKSIDSVMAAQAELVDVVHTLKQVMCIKG